MYGADMQKVLWGGNVRLGTRVLHTTQYCTHVVCENYTYVVYLLGIDWYRRIK